MTNSCCAPNCENGYKPKKKKKKNIKQNQEENLGDTEENEPEENDLITGKKKVSVFVFPSHEEEAERRATWISRVPRDNWHPKETIVT